MLDLEGGRDNVAVQFIVRYGTVHPTWVDETRCGLRDREMSEVTASELCCAWLDLARYVRVYYAISFNERERKTKEGFLVM